MRIGLFVPCYIDQFYPDVGFATLELLERVGCQVEFPMAQTCCGQPMANTGCNDQTRPLAEKFFRVFRSYDHVVAPSGSCVSMVRHHYQAYLDGRTEFQDLCQRTWELCEFLMEVVQVDSFPVRFPYRVGLHASCHGLRELRLDPCSELQGGQSSKVRTLLQRVEGLELVTLQRPDECCGFGGTFAVAEEGVSILMGEDRVQDHEQAGAQVIAATDMSCLMHMEGILRRQRKKLGVMHVAQILAGRTPPR